MGAAASAGMLGLAGADVEDEFTVIGVAPGTPLTFKARLELALEACAFNFGFAGAYGGLRAPDGTGNTVNIDACAGCIPPCFSDQRVAEMDINAIAGQPFRMVYRAGVSSAEGGEGNAQGQLGFADLPTGASIQSCYGFRQDFVVPVRPASWGKIKVLYR